MLERVFKSFYARQHQSVWDSASQAARSISEAHGGRHSASAKQRQGATFQFTLPDEANILS